MLAVRPKESSMVRILAISLLIFGIVAVATAGDPPGKFRITSKKKDDSVEVRADKDKTVFVVTSPSGISQAAIERLDEAWPKTVVIRLNLKGLESFRINNGKATLDGAVSLQEGTPKVRLWKDGKEGAPLDAKSPLWTDIRILGGDGKPAKSLPLKDGYFEVALPKALIEGNPKALTVSWTDFFRG
jgi:hypothetical protein